MQCIVTQHHSGNSGVYNMNYTIFFIYLMPKQQKCIAALHVSSGSPISAYAAGLQPGPPAWSAEPTTSHPFRTGDGADLQVWRLQSDQRRKSPSCLIAPISSHRTTGVFFGSAGVAAD
jgi:hypothetical protein